MRRVIFNADDFGMTDGVCAGIADALRAGLVRSTSAMACAAGSLQRVRQWAPTIPRMGVHLQLSDGAPCLSADRVPSLVGPDGRFPRRPDLRRVRRDEVLAEWSAQIDAIAGAGVTVTHIDTHINLHLDPAIRPVYIELALARGLPARSNTRAITADLRRSGVPCPDRCVLDYYGGDLSPEALLRHLRWAFLKNLNRGTIEVMCHPARVDASLPDTTTYVDERAKELETLCSDRLRQLLAANRIEVAGPAVILDAPDVVHTTSP